MMMIGGVGSVPTDLGVAVSKTMFAPRVGFTYRITERSVVRAGFGITNDPYSLARPMRTNHPAVLNLILDGSGSLSYVSRTSEGIPDNPDRRSGKRHHSGPEPGHRLHARRQVRARLHPLVQRRLPARARTWLLG